MVRRWKNLVNNDRADTTLLFLTCLLQTEKDFSIVLATSTQPIDRNKLFCLHLTNKSLIFRENLLIYNVKNA